jgi:hypothetical protein
VAFSATEKGQELGSGLGKVGDVDGDGLDDLVVGAARSDAQARSAGAAFLLSGATGALLLTWGGAATPSPSRFGDAVAGAGDADLDGVPDVAVGAPDYVLAGEYGRADVFRGGTDDELMHVTGGPSEFFGRALAGGLDVDGSGTPDLLVGAPATVGPFEQHDGSASLFDASTGALLATFPGEGVSETGASVALGDVDQDGRADVLVGEPTWDAPGQFSTGRVRVFSGDGFGLMAEARGSASAENAGRAVAVLGDLDVDGLTDWVMGVPSQLPQGAVHAFAGRVSWLDAGQALAGAGGEPHATGSGALVTGTPLTIAIAGGPPSAPATLVLGGSALNAPFKGGVLVPALGALLPGLPLDGDGALVLEGACPPGLPSGFALWLQFWMPDAGGPAGFSASNGLTTTAP